MTTPDTSAVRAWARDNGYQVADRGRLPADVTGAYLAANGKRSAAKKAAPAKPAARKAAAVNVAAEQAAPARRAAAAKVAPAPVDKAEAPVAEQAPAEPRPKPSLVNDDRRLVALGEEITALTRRVEALEKASGGGKANGRTARFRRRS